MPSSLVILLVCAYLAIRRVADVAAGGAPPLPFGPGFPCLLDSTPVAESAARCLA